MYRRYSNQLMNVPHGVHSNNGKMMKASTQISSAPRAEAKKSAENNVNEPAVQKQKSGQDRNDAERKSEQLHKTPMGHVDRHSQEERRTGGRNGEKKEEGAGKRKALDIGKLIEGLIPASLYNTKTKKFLGVIGAEDLLLIALIFLFMESDEKNNQSMLLALIYVLISDYIELPDFSL